MAETGAVADWQGHSLETPPLTADGEINWGGIWLYQSKNGVGAPRPVFTGDVFKDVHVLGDGSETTTDIVILQHPCALRTDGNELRSMLLAARLIDYSCLSPAEWSGNYDVMPLVVAKSVPPIYQAASFDQLVLVESTELTFVRRIACMKLEGIGLLLQRWTNMNTRVVIPTHRFEAVTNLQVAEADGIEDWCKERQQARVKPAIAAKEATAWLDAKNEEVGVKRRVLLENPQMRKGIVKAMARAAKAMTDEQLTARAAAKAAASSSADHTDSKTPRASPEPPNGDVAIGARE